MLYLVDCVTTVVSIIYYYYVGMYAGKFAVEGIVQNRFSRWLPHFLLVDFYITTTTTTTQFLHFTRAPPPPPPLVNIYCAVRLARLLCSAAVRRTNRIYNNRTTNTKQLLHHSIHCALCSWPVVRLPLFH